MEDYSTIMLTDEEKKGRHLTIQCKASSNHSKIYWKKGGHALAHLQFNTSKCGHLSKKFVFAALNEWNSTRCCAACATTEPDNECIELNIHDKTIQNAWKPRFLHEGENPADFILAIIEGDAAPPAPDGLHVHWWKAAMINVLDHTIRLRSSTTNVINPNGKRTWQQSLDSKFHVQLTTLQVSNHFWHVLTERLSTQYEKLAELR